MWYRKLARAFGYSLFGLGVFYCLLLWSAAHLDAYEGGILKAHNHTSLSGDGGQLSNLAVTGTLSAGTLPTQVSTITAGGAIVFGTGVTNPITFPDNTVLTSTGAFIVPGSSPTVSGTWIFNGVNPVALSTGVTIGDSGQLNQPNLYWYAKSLDGASEVQNCLGVMTTNASHQLVWTSTTAASGVHGAIVAIADASCAPGTTCKIFKEGVVQITITNGPGVVGDCVENTTTRCQGVEVAAFGQNCNGEILNTGASVVDVMYGAP